MQKKIIRAYDGELERSKQPGYKPSYDDDFDDIDYMDQDSHSHHSYSVERTRARHDEKVEEAPGRAHQADGGTDSFGAGIL